MQWSDDGKKFVVVPEAVFYHDNKAFKKSVGLNGVGTKAVNALSIQFKVESIREGKKKIAIFEQGVLKDEIDKEIYEDKSFFRYVFEYTPTVGKKVNYAKKNYLSNSNIQSTNPILNHIHLESILVERYDYLGELNDNIIKGGNTFIGLKDMTSIEINDVLCYYVLGLSPNTKYHELHPGVADNPYYQSELLEQLVTKNNYVILLDLEPETLTTRDNKFNEKLNEVYSFVIKTPSMDLLINKKEYLDSN